MVLAQLAVSMQRNENISLLISLYKSQVQVDQKSLHKTRYTELLEEKVVKSLEDIGTGESFLGRTPMDYGLRSRIDN